MAARVFVGISGGVDSAVAAAMLLDQGYDVTGVYMKNWSRDLPGFTCPWAEELAWAERAAWTLGIDLLVWDCEKEYKETVVDYLVDAYAKGLTPNPDVMCNQTVKFGTFAERAFSEGASYVASGHYARVIHGVDGAPARLFRAADEHKDQTYFLWRVAGTTFNKALFPLADFATKEDVREFARSRGLENAEKPDSDGICFIGPVGLRTFLLDSLERQAGDIVEWETGSVLGKHDGAFLYTIGQRKGLNVGGGPARYVVKTDTESNTVYVSADSQCELLWTSKHLLNDCYWIAGTAPKEGRYLVRTRHTGALLEAELKFAEGGAVVVFDEPVKTVAAGQSCVIYEDKECLGGGIICLP